MTEHTRRRFLGAAAALTSISAGGSATAADEESDRPDRSNDYPNTRRMKGGTGHALTGIWSPEQWTNHTRGETEDFGGVTELELYQHALQWGMGISLKIRKGDVETAIDLDVDRAEVLGHWLLEAASDTRRWRAENPEAWEYTKEGRKSVADRIEDPILSDSELGWSDE